MCADSCFEHSCPVLGRLLPERCLETRKVIVLIPAPHIIHQDIQSTLLSPHRIKHALHLPIISMITSQSNTNSTSLTAVLSCLINGLGKILSRMSFHTATRNVDSRTSLA